MQKDKDLKLICRLDKRWNPRAIDVKKAGGQTNRNYVVAFKGKKFFVRLPWESAALDRSVEGRNIVQLAHNKKLRRILPQYYIYVLSGKNILSPKDTTRYDLPDGTMAAEYLQGKEFSMRHFKQKRYQKVLAQTFALFHTSGVKFVNPYNVFRDEIQKYRVEASKHRLEKLLDRHTVGKLQKIEKEASKRISVLRKGVSTHNDFLFHNLIIGKSNRIYLLDFEYAGLNNKGGILYDIGYFFVDHLFRTPRMTKSLFDEFLGIADKVYGKKLDRVEIYWLSVAAILVQIWWGILRYFSVSPKERPYFKEYVQKRVAGTLKLYKELKEKES